MFGRFVGYHRHAGGHWSGDYLVTDLEELNEAEAARDVHVKRIKESDVPLGNWTCPLADGAARQPDAKKRRSRPTNQIWESENAGGEPSTKDDTSGRAGGDSGETEPENGNNAEDNDFWTVSGHALVRHHRTPRSRMFEPTETSDCPVPLKYVDVTRFTKTDLEVQSEISTYDTWLPGEAQRELSAPWTGKTKFDLIRQIPPPGHTYVDGRLTKSQETTRPGNVWPEVWKSMSTKAKKLAIKEWIPELKSRTEARAKRGIEYVPEAEMEDYYKLLTDTRQR